MGIYLGKRRSSRLNIYRWKGTLHSQPLVPATGGKISTTEEKTYQMSSSQPYLINSSSRVAYHASIPRALTKHRSGGTQEKWGNKGKNSQTRILLTFILILPYVDERRRAGGLRFEVKDHFVSYWGRTMGGMRNWELGIGNRGIG